MGKTQSKKIDDSTIEFHHSGFIHWIPPWKSGWLVAPWLTSDSTIKNVGLSSAHGADIGWSSTNQGFLVYQNPTKSPSTSEIFTYFTHVNPCESGKAWKSHVKSPFPQVFFASWSSAAAMAGAHCCLAAFLDDRRQWWLFWALLGYSLYVTIGFFPV